MKKVLHIEDSVYWQKKVESALALSLGVELMVPIGDMTSFREREYPFAHLYICDRHLPLRVNNSPDDTSWRQILEVIRTLYPDAKCLFLAQNPPANWRNYGNVVCVIRKECFEVGKFRSTVESILDLNVGTERGVTPYVFR